MASVPFLGGCHRVRLVCPFPFRRGHHPARDVRVDDLLLSRDEADPDGMVVARRVEEVFKRGGLIWNLRVKGRDIRTTAEHPFWVEGRGWTPCNALQVGDRLRLREGWTAVEAVEDTGVWEAVYNFRIADDHTYFVGCTEWGFSVWAHNADYDVYPQHGGRYSVRYRETPGSKTEFATELNGDITKFASKVDADAWVASHQAATARVLIPGDADFVGTFPRTWPLVPGGAGAHMVERSQVVGRPGLAVFDQPGTPRFYPTGTTQNAGAAHVRLHEATRDAGVRLRIGAMPWRQVWKTSGTVVSCCAKMALLCPFGELVVWQRHLLERSGF